MSPSTRYLMLDAGYWMEDRQNAGRNRGPLHFGLRNADLGLNLIEFLIRTGERHKILDARCWILDERQAKRQEIGKKWQGFSKKNL